MEKKTDALVESRIRWKVYVRFGGECLETDHRNMTRRWVLSLRYTVLYNDGTSEFIQNKVNLRYKVIDVDAGDVNIHLTDLLDEMKADGRCRTKVRIHATAAQASSIQKEKLLNAGASKVEIVTEETEVTDVSASGLFEKFDSRKIRETYEEFCREKEIAEVELGLSYLSKIDGVCGN